MGIRLAPGEHTYVNVTATMRAMVFPTLELLLISGVMWMLIGYFDRIPVYDEFGEQTGLTLGVQGRNILVLIWMLLCVLRFFLPLIRVCRSCLIVTNYRVLLRAPGLTTSMDTIPIQSIHSAGRRGNNITLNIHGFGPVHLQNMPRTKKVAQTINELVAASRQPMHYV